MAKKRHTPGTLPYFRVSGERRASSVNEEGDLVYDGDVVLPSRTRFETLSLSEAEKFATTVYRAEGIVCEIHEMSR